MTSPAPDSPDPVLDGDELAAFLDAYHGEIERVGLRPDGAARLADRAAAEAMAIRLTASKAWEAAGGFWAALKTLIARSPAGGRVFDTALKRLQAPANPPPTAAAPEPDKGDQRRLVWSTRARLMVLATALCLAVLLIVARVVWLHLTPENEAADRPVIAPPSPTATLLDPPAGLVGPPAIAPRTVRPVGSDWEIIFSQQLQAVVAVSEVLGHVDLMFAGGRTRSGTQVTDDPFELTDIRFALPPRSGGELVIALAANRPFEPATAIDHLLGRIHAIDLGTTDYVVADDALWAGSLPFEPQISARYALVDLARIGFEEEAGARLLIQSETALPAPWIVEGPHPSDPGMHVRLIIFPAAPLPAGQEIEAATPSFDEAFTSAFAFLTPGSEAPGALRASAHGPRRVARGYGHLGLENRSSAAYLAAMLSAGPMNPESMPEFQSAFQFQESLRNYQPNARLGDAYDGPASWNRHVRESSVTGRYAEGDWRPIDPGFLFSVEPGQQSRALRFLTDETPLHPALAERNLPYARMLAAGPGLALILIALFSARRRLKAYLMRRRLNTPAEEMSLLAEASRALNAPSADMRRTASRMTQREEGQETALDIQATIEATIERGGFLTPVETPRLTPPVYLALINRESPQDLEFDRARRLIALLREEGVHVVQYVFFGDPRVLWEELADGRLGERLSLSALRERFPNAVLLYFSTGHEAIDPLSLKPWSWTRGLTHWRRRYLASPLPQTAWDIAEARLGDTLGFTLTRATLPGLAMITPQAEAIDPAATSARLEDAAPRTPDFVREGGGGFLSEAEPSDHRWDRLDAELRFYLGPDGHDWLAACAAYPELRWDLAFHIGMRLPSRRSPENGPMRPVYSEDSLAQLTVLPWFRQGFMPRWLRKKLLAGMPPDRAAEARKIIIELIAPGELEAGAAETETGAPSGLFARGLIRLGLFRPSRSAEALPPPLEDVVTLDFVARGDPGSLDPMIEGELLKRLGPRGWSAFLVSSGPLLAAGLIAALGGAILAPAGDAPSAEGDWLPIFTFLAVFAVSAPLLWRASLPPEAPR